MVGAILWESVAQNYPPAVAQFSTPAATFSTPRRQMGKIWPALIKQRQKMVVRLEVLCLADGGPLCHFLA